MKLSKEIEDLKKLIIDNQIGDATNIINSIKIDSLNIEELNVIATYYFKNKEYLKSKKIFSTILNVDKNYMPALLNLGVLEQHLENYEDALKYLNRLLSIDNTSWQAYNNIGFLFNKKKEYSKAKAALNKSIEINPSYPESNFNIGKSFFFTNDLINAEKYLLISTNLKSKFPEAYYYLGEIYRQKKLFKKSLDNFVKSRHKWTTIRVLECLLLLDMKDIYDEQISKLCQIEPENRRTAAATAYYSNQFNFINEYNFCKDPINYISKYNLLDDLKNEKLNLKDLLLEIKEQETLWEIPSRTTINGTTTKKNLSLLKLNFYQKLEKIFLIKLNEFKQEYKKSKELMIKNWPTEYLFNSWSNTLKKEGYNIPHIHPSGWVSGVFYLNVPEKLKNNEGGIEFSLHGYDFINNKKLTTNSLHIPKIGDLILFPSSLFHKTIPFDSNGERICIAFDFCKIK